MFYYLTNQDKIQSLECYIFKKFFIIKNIRDRLPVFMQETIYHVRTEMRQSLVYYTMKKTFKGIEPPHDKTNKMTMGPAKTQISLDIRLVWSESSMCGHWVAKDTSFLHADIEDLSLRWAHMPFCWFCHEAAQNI